MLHAIEAGALDSLSTGPAVTRMLGDVVSRYVTGPLEGSILTEDVGRRVADAPARALRLSHEKANEIAPKESDFVNLAVPADALDVIVEQFKREGPPAPDDKSVKEIYREWLRQRGR